MRINKSNKTEIWVLNVARGLSIIIKTHHDFGLIYDLGSTENFSPLKFLNDNKLINNFTPYFIDNQQGKKIAQCLISHPHLDHISDLTDENIDFLNKNTFYVTCQNDKKEADGSEFNKPGHAIDFNRINNPSNSGNMIEHYKNLYNQRELPLRTLIHTSKFFIPNLTMGYYYLNHKQANKLFPNDDQKYSNSLSIVFYLSHGKDSILIPGDITPEAIELIIDGNCEKRFTDYSSSQTINEKKEWATTTSNQPILKDLLKNGLTILVAPHHGLESGYPEYLFEIMGNKVPELIVISEKRHNTEMSGSIHKNYQNGKGSSGKRHKKKLRYSLSTANDGNIRITLSGTDCVTDSSKEIKEIFD